MPSRSQPCIKPFRLKGDFWCPIGASEASGSLARTDGNHDRGIVVKARLGAERRPWPAGCEPLIKDASPPGAIPAAWHSATRSTAGSLGYCACRAACSALIRTLMRSFAASASETRAGNKMSSCPSSLIIEISWAHRRVSSSALCLPPLWRGFIAIDHSYACHNLRRGMRANNRDR